MGKNTDRLIWIAVLLLPLAVFGQTIGFDFVWDDEVNVAANPYLNPVTAESFLRFWLEPYERLYVPLTYTFWSVLALFAGGVAGAGLLPGPFHTANVFLHALSALIVYRILQMLLRAPWPAAAGALLFAVHPLQVESVAWITGLKDVLSGLASLLAIWQFLCYASTRPLAGATAGERRPRAAAGLNDQKKLERKAQVHYALATLAFTGALLAKPAAVATPFIALALDYWLLGRPLRESVWGISLWLGIAVPVVAGTTLAQPQSELEFVTPLWARPLVAADALGFYLGKFFLPLGLTADYGRVPEWVLAQKSAYFFSLLALALAVFAWRAGARRPWLIAAAAIFGIAILPVSGLVPFSFQNMSTVADRYLYLALFGPALAMGEICAERKEKLVSIACGAVILLLALSSAWQARYWQNDGTLFARIRELNPESWTAHYGLGRVLAREGDIVRAISSFREAARIKPEFTNAHFSLGSLLASQGDVPGAIAAYRKALEIAPQFLEARIGLANALAQAGDLDGSVREYRAAAKLAPGRADVYFHLGSVLALKGDVANAAQALSQALGVKTDFVEAHHLLGRVLAAQGDLERAMAHFREAVRLRPGFAEAHQSLALALAQAGRIDEAQRHANEARRLAAPRAR